MPLQPFSFPYPETRFFKRDSLIYKFKIRGGTSYSGEEVMKGECFNQELEDIVTTVLDSLNYLKPFSTAHYTAFPYKKHWEKVRKRSEKKMQFYPFVIILLLEKNIHKAAQTRENIRVSEKPCPKCRRRDSPLEEAILKELVKNMEVERNESVTGEVKTCHQPAEEEVCEDPTLVDDEPEMTQDPADEERTPGILRRLVRNVLHFIFRTPGTYP